jgi:prolipoprotein diacylglyceryltransferase
VEFLKIEQSAFEKGMFLDMGQLLSIPFIIGGLYFMFRKEKEIINKKIKSKSAH